MEHVYNCTGHELKIADIVASGGTRVTDREGRYYLDLASGVWCTVLGHNHPRIRAAMTAQMDRLMHAGYCYSGAVVEDAARAVLEITGFEGGRCAFLCSGSEAIEISRQIARHLSGNPLSLTLHDSYLGAYSSVADRSRGWHVFDWEDCRTCGRREGCDLRCPRLEAVPEGISDFVFEPGSSSGFVRFPPRALIRNLARRVRRGGGKVIANEVTTGSGRTGKWFGYQHYDLTPDMVAAGKGVGNGYPVSVAVLDEATAAALVHRPFRYAQSHMNDPLGAAVVLETIRVIEEEGLVAQAERKGRLLLRLLEDLVDGSVLTGVRGRGLMLAVDFADPGTCARVYDELVADGYLVSNRRTGLRIDPPLIVSEEELAGFAAALRRALGRRGG